MPITAHQGRCSATQSAGFLSACLSTTATAATCDAFFASDLACAECIVGPQPGTAPATVATPALIPVGDYIFLNAGACEALAVGAPAGCAQSYSNATLCGYSTCETCDLNVDGNACLSYSATHACAASQAPAACDAAIAADKTLADATCLATTFEGAYRKLVPFICGP
jgi:hypothetical protein